MSKAEQTAAADDLDDGLAYDETLVASDVETEPSGAVFSDDNAEVEEPNLKKRKKSSKLQDKKRLKMEMDMERKKNLSLETTPEVIAEYLNNRIRDKNSDLSTLELAEKYLNKTDIRSSAEFTENRTLDNFSKYFNSRFSNMLPNTKANKTSKKKKAPETEPQSEREEQRKFIAVLSMSAIRACDVHRAVKDLLGSSLKLINKNKIEVDLKLIGTTRSRVLCCTPGRLLKVLENEDAQLTKDEIKIVILDNSYLDKKCQNVLDIKETTEALKYLADGGAKIYLY